MPTTDPLQSPDSIAQKPRGRISLVTAIWISFFLLICGFVVIESVNVIRSGMAPIALNLCVFYLPILSILGWYIRKRILKELL
jgi:4-hydroxybenzoate polyprenyltransferase